MFRLDVLEVAAAFVELLSDRVTVGDRGLERTRMSDREVVAWLELL